MCIRDSFIAFPLFPNHYFNISGLLPCCKKMKKYAFVGAPFLWGPLFGRTCWTCLNPPLPWTVSLLSLSYHNNKWRAEAWKASGFGLGFIISIFLACYHVAKMIFCAFLGPLFVGAPVRPNMLNMPKSASGVHHNYRILVAHCSACLYGTSRMTTHYGYDTLRLQVGHIPVTHCYRFSFVVSWQKAVHAR